MKENTTQYPIDWNQVRVGDIAKVKGGKRLPYGFYVVDTPTPYPYLRVLDMYPGGVNQSDIKYVPEQAFPAIQNYRIYSEDIFISVAGSLGIVGVVPPELSGANLTENANYITDIQCDRDYLKYWLMSHPIQNVIKLIQTTGAQPKLALGRIAKFVVAIPQDIKEQRAIAEALSDVDGLLNALEVLITKKRAIKQAVMQQLLTGRTRLPGFSGAWETKQLGDISQIKKGSMITEKDVVLGTIPVIAGGQKPAYYHNTANRSGKTITVSASGAYAGFVALYNQPIFASDCSTISESSRYSIDFIYYYLVFNQKVIYNAQTGGAQPHCYPTDLMTMQIDLPAIDEQRAIAAVLSDMDTEITALEQRRDKTRAIKQGMMQQLLTGRVRLSESRICPDDTD